MDALVKEEKSFKGFSIFSSGGHLAQRSGTISTILVDSHLRNIPVKSFQNLSTDLAEEVLKKLISIYSPGGHFVQHSGIV